MSINLFTLPVYLAEWDCMEHKTSSIFYSNKQTEYDILMNVQ